MFKWTSECVAGQECVVWLIILWLLLGIPGVVNVLLYALNSRWKEINWGSRLKEYTVALPGMLSVSLMLYPYTYEAALDRVTWAVPLCVLNFSLLGLQREFSLVDRGATAKRSSARAVRLLILLLHLAMCWKLVSYGVGQ
jgi:hypothetical protein